MDCNPNNGNVEHWDWERRDYNVKNDPKFGPDCMWTEVTLNEEDLSYMYDEATPVKACGDLAYHVTNSENVSKKPEELREASSHQKRRRMLQFDAKAVDVPYCDDEITYAFLKSNESGDSLDDILPQVSQWDSGFSDVPVSSYGFLDHSSERWLAACINDTDMQYCPSDCRDFSGASDIQIDVSEFCNGPPQFEANLVQKCVPWTTRNIVVKGRKSLINTPTKLASSVAYPFAIIKPCGMTGDVTLKDINQRIRAPPPSKSKQDKDDPAAYPTSAFSGKPVVGKTKIRTEGGKGSITITRTKG